MTLLLAKLEGEIDKELRPVAGCGKLYRARFRLYRSLILEANMRLKALGEMVTRRCLLYFETS